MTAKFSASADGTKVNIGNAAEDALQIDSTAKTIKALAPYSFDTLKAGDPGTIAASCVVTVSGGVPTKNSSYNVGVVGRPSAGLFNVTLDPPLPNDRAAVTVNATNLASGIIATVSSLTTTNVGLAFYAVSGLPADPSGFSVIVTRQP